MHVYLLEEYLGDADALIANVSLKMTPHKDEMLFAPWYFPHREFASLIINLS